MFWYIVIPGTFVAYFASMLILIHIFEKMGMYDE